MSNEEPLCILVVDDNQAVLGALATLLRADGFSVLAVETSPQAMSTMQSESVDVVIADASLGSQSGAALLDTIRQEFPHIATILMSGYTPENLASMDIVVGTHHFVPKPFRTPELVEAIDQAKAAAKLRSGTT